MSLVGVYEAIAHSLRCPGGKQRGIMARKPTQDEVLRSLDKKIDKVLSILDNVHNRGIKVMLNVEELKSSVESNTNAFNAGVELILAQVAELEASAGDEQAVRDAAAQMRDNAEGMMAAVLKGTAAESDAETPA